MKQMYRPNVLLHFPSETRILILTEKILAMCSARPGLPCSTVLFHVPNTALLLNQPEKTEFPGEEGRE